MSPIAYLFVPANRPERFAKALGSGADAVIIDLEDAVAPAEKANARAALHDWLARRPASGAGSPPIHVRINAADTAFHDADLATLDRYADIGIMVPKCEAPAALARAVLADLRRPPAIVLIESVAGFDQLAGLAATAGVGRLAFGELDYCLDIDATGDGASLAWPMTMIVHASRRAGLPAPIAGITTALDDPAAIRADVAKVRAFGFGAKLCIHPKQVAAVHAAFAPSAAELDWAKRVMALVEAGSVTAQLDGKMIDRPVITRAQSILNRADVT